MWNLEMQNHVHGYATVCHRDECSSQLSVVVGITVAGIWSFGHFSHFKGRSEVRDLAWPGPLPEGH